jgi:hypothetical protein
MSVSAESSVKKRGRPRKNAVADALDVDVDVVLESGTRGKVSPVQETKTRGKGKPAAKKSASAAATSGSSSRIAASTSAPTSTPTSSKRKPKGLVQGAGLADPVDESNVAAGATKIKAAAGTKPRGRATSRSSAVKEQESTSVQSPALEGRSTAKGEARVKGAAVASPSLPSSSQEENTAAVRPRRQIVSETSHPLQTTGALVGSVSISEILQQAKAFSAHSTQLQQGILAFVGELERERKRERERASLLSPSLTHTPEDDGEVQQRLVSHFPAGVGTTTAAIAGSPPSTVPAIDIDIETSSTSTHLPPFPSPPSPPSPLPKGAMPPPHFKTATIIATGSAPQVRAYSSTPPLPMSTTVALAARGSHARANLPPPPRPATATTRTPPNPPIDAEPRHPLPFTHPSAAPRAPKLSEMPLEQRKKDPRYRKATIRYTSAIVALPFAIVTTYLLWEKCMLFPLCRRFLLSLCRWVSRRHTFLLFFPWSYSHVLSPMADLSCVCVRARIDQEHQIYLGRVREARAAAENTVAAAPAIGALPAPGRGDTARPGTQDRE